MPNIKSAIKSVKQNACKNVQNSHAKHAMRTAVRKAEVALDNKDENATSSTKSMRSNKLTLLHVKALSIKILHHVKKHVLLKKHFNFYIKRPPDYRTVFF